jgi:23S rRNA (guanosine2251-2'-O)-methyltransferase
MKHRHSKKSSRSEEILYGRQPVMEALRAKRRTIHELCLLRTAKASPRLDEITSEAHSRKIPVRKVDRNQLDEMTSDGNHQGVALRASSYPYLEMDDLLGYLRKRESDPLVLLLDHIEDVQNVGSLLRAVDAAGVDAVVLPSRRAAGITPAAVRASAGAAEHVKACLVSSFMGALKILQDEGIRFACLESLPDAQTYTDADLTGALGLIVGSEGKGVTKQAREYCDTILKIPMSGKVSSLNAAQAGAITLFEIQRQRNLK